MSPRRRSDAERGEAMVEVLRELLSEALDDALPAALDAHLRPYMEELRTRSAEVLDDARRGRSPFEEAPPLTVDEARRRLGVSESTLRRMIRQGTLEAQRIGQRLRIREADVTRYLARRKGR